MRVRVKHHKATHHKATHHKAAHHKAAHHATKKATATKKASRSSSGVTGAQVSSALQQDPQALSTLTQQVASNLFSGGFAQEIVNAILAVTGIQQTHQAGRLIAGVVSSAAGALYYTGTQGNTAAVLLNGATTPALCYVQPHMVSELKAGHHVWVEPINGRMDDLMIVAIRGISGNPPVL